MSNSFEAREKRHVAKIVYKYIEIVSTLVHHFDLRSNRAVWIQHGE